MKGPPMAPRKAKAMSSSNERGFLGLSKGKIQTKDEFLALCLVVATIPAILAGLAIKMTGFDVELRDNVALIGAAMMGFGIVLWWSDR